jgi:dCMP deaminase
MAHEVASWSKDPSTQVGARITRGKILVSEGFNGPPAGMQDDPAIDRETKLRRTLHAEQNAILYAQRDLTGCTMYVTHHPCARCAAQIAQAGIKRVVCNAPDPAFAVRWAEDIAEAQLILTHAGVELVSLEV